MHRCIAINSNFIFNNGVVVNVKIRIYYIVYIENSGRYLRGRYFYLLLVFSDNAMDILELMYV